MEKNVKKRSASHIYFGIDKDTGALQHISQVSSGAKCNCKCALCGEAFEARKGSQRKHHFAHVSNYECMYAGEVAVYMGFADALRENDAIQLPPVTLDFPTWAKPEVLQQGRTMAIEEVSYECKELAYPPMLLITTSGSKLRIILDFGHYYDEDDKAMLAAEAKREEYALMMYHMPKIDDDSFSPEQLGKIITAGDQAYWVFSRLEQQWRDRYLSMAITPPEHGLGYLCPISIGKYKGKYSARYEDCAYCRFNLANAPGCLCIAAAGIQSKDDFKRSESERKADIEKMRLANEADIERREAAIEAQRVEREKRIVAMQKRFIPVVKNEKPKQPTLEELENAYLEVKAAFNPDSTSWTTDRYSRRWIQCKVCGEIKRDNQMSSYGGSDGVNRGVCSLCSRKGLG